MKKIVENIKKMLTKRHKSGIIICKKMPLCYDDTCREEVNKNMDVRILANYLIQCFWNTRINGQRIKCTRTKIGKLLTIVQLLSIKHTQHVAFEDAIVAETCGTSIPILSVHRYPYDIWELHSCKFPNNAILFEKNSVIDLSDTSIVSEPLPELYSLQDDISDLIKNIIRDVFEKYGTYDGYEIGKLINEFKTDICSDGIVCEEKVITWLANINAQSTNSIIDFVHNHVLCFKAD